MTTYLSVLDNEMLRGLAPPAMSRASFLAAVSSWSCGTTASTRPSLSAALSLMGCMYHTHIHACTDTHTHTYIPTWAALPSQAFPAEAEKGRGGWV